VGAPTTKVKRIDGSAARGVLTDERGAEMSNTPSGARFFDEKRHDRGWASQVTRRVRRIDGLTTLDVTTKESRLAAFLSSLDRSPLRVQDMAGDGESYTFAWASGYENGPQIRVQGMLESPQRPWPL
jgi:hypothetical protein